MEAASPESLDALEVARATSEGLLAAKLLQRHARVAGQSLARFRDDPPSDPAVVHTVVRQLRRNAFAAANRLGAVKPTPAQPQEAQHDRTDRP